MAMQVAALDVLTTKGGFAPEVARAIGEVVDMEIARSRETLATSHQVGDVERSVRKDLEETKRSLTARIEEVNTSLGARIEKVNTSLGVRIEEVNTSLGVRIDKLEHSLNTRTDHVETSLKGEIAAVNKKLDSMVTRPEFDAKFDALRHEIDSKLAKLNTGIVRWVFMVGMGNWAVQAATIMAMFKLFATHAP